MAIEKKDETTRTPEIREPEKSWQEQIGDAANGEIANDPNSGNIVWKGMVPDGNGGLKEVQHGPMSREEWKKFETEKGL